MPDPFAQKVLGGDPKFAWLFEGDQTPILDALGGISDKATLREVAEEICREKPPTKRAVFWAECRHNDASPALRLHCDLWAFLSRACENNPALTPEDAVWVLGRVMDAIRTLPSFEPSDTVH